MNENSSFETIVKFVNTHFNSEEDKVRAYYRWVAANIEYDVLRMEAMQEKRLPQSSKAVQNADSVFKNRKAVCEGYSNLMQKFCLASGILCEVIPGYTKSTKDGKTMQLLHSWNMVKTSGEWKPLDATWANSYALSNGNYRKQFTGNYFLIDPSVFIQDHLPLDPMWQLLERPLTKDGFSNGTGQTIGYFNYTDSLSSYFKRDINERAYVDMQRYHAFSPADTAFTRALDVFHNNKAAGYLSSASSNYKEYVKLLNGGFSERSSNEDCKKAISILNASLHDLNRTLTYLKDKSAFTEEFTKNFEYIKKSAQTNLSAVQKHLAILTKYQKKLSVAN